MAFLDNSGDIILDAVLTDLGRKRMAEGDFRITQFALGDDEIDYSLYDANHPSGSAYFDLEILQTPVFEAFTRGNANINYGLLTFDGNADILYLPSMAINESTLTSAKRLYNNVIYLAVNQQTRDALVDAAAIGNTEQVVLEGGNEHVLFETGLNTANNDPAGTAKNRTDYIVNTGLLDSTMTLTADARFLSAVYAVEEGSTFSYPAGASAFNVTINLKGQPTPPTAGATGVVGRRVYTIPTISNLVEDQDVGGTTQATDISSINGPRGVATAMGFSVSPELRRDKNSAAPAKFSLHGKISQDLFGDSKTYDYIDTVIYLNGNTSGANIQTIIRIIRQAS